MQSSWAEGYMYLGLGMIVGLFLILPSLSSWPRELTSRVKTKPYFYLLLLGFAVFAISNQIGIGQLRSLQEAASSHMPFPTPDVAILGKVEHIYWLALMSVYEYKHQEAILKLINRYDTKMS
jgi:hypothetical protein